MILIAVKEVYEELVQTFSDEDHFFKDVDYEEVSLNYQNPKQSIYDRMKGIRYWTLQYGDPSFNILMSDHVGFAMVSKDWTKEDLWEVAKDLKEQIEESVAMS